MHESHSTRTLWYSCGMPMAPCLLLTTGSSNLICFLCPPCTNHVISDAVVTLTQRSLNQANWDFSRHVSLFSTIDTLTEIKALVSLTNNISDYFFLNSHSIYFILNLKRRTCSRTCSRTSKKSEPSKIQAKLLCTADGANHKEIRRVQQLKHSDETKMIAGTLTLCRANTRKYKIIRKKKTEKHHCFLLMRGHFSVLQQMHTHSSALHYRHSAFWGA